MSSLFLNYNKKWGELVNDVPRKPLTWLRFEAVIAASMINNTASDHDLPF